MQSRHTKLELVNESVSSLNCPGFTLSHTTHVFGFDSICLNLSNALLGVSNRFIVLLNIVGNFDNYIDFHLRKALLSNDHLYDAIFVHGGNEGRD
jgi:hypothetical protein